MKTVSDPINTRQETGWRKGLEEIGRGDCLRLQVRGEMSRSNKTNRNDIVFLFFVCVCNYWKWRCDQWNTMENNASISTERHKMASLCYIVAKGKEGGRQGGGEIRKVWQLNKRIGAHTHMQTQKSFPVIRSAVPMLCGKKCDWTVLFFKLKYICVHLHVVPSRECCCIGVI